MKNQIIILSCILMQLTYNQCYSQQTELSQKRWSNVVLNQPAEWYGSIEAKRIAENVLLYQKDNGGWPKNVSMQHELTELEHDDIVEQKSDLSEATIDNGATYLELIYLHKVYPFYPEERYRNAFNKGVQYILQAQYPNGGWPQFYPLKKNYSRHITYNDDAMLDAMLIMKGVAENTYSIHLDEKTRTQAQQAFDKGLSCILLTQYVQNGILTAWCAQHDEVTLQPAPARTFELVSLSGKESADIVLLLMSLDTPSPEVINAVQSAVAWFDAVKITGYSLEKYTNTDGLKDRHIVADSTAKPLWARFYTLEDNKPFFCDRDGIKRFNMDEIGYERRNGYGWYVQGPRAVLKRYPEWQKQWAPEKNVLLK